MTYRLLWCERCSVAFEAVVTEELDGPVLFSDVPDPHIDEGHEWSTPGFGSATDFPR